MPTGAGEGPVRGVMVHRLARHHDLRGDLYSAEVGGGLPFEPLRLFVVRDVPSHDVRGQHAHRTVHQFLVCLAGECTLAVDDGRQRLEIRLDSPAIGVHLEPMVWAAQQGFSPDAVLLVLASGRYDADEYIRDYREFLALVEA